MNQPVTAGTTADLVVVGAGIVGLATAMQVLEQQPAMSVIVVDKEGEIGLHQTGRNSGVIHRGVYYTPGSLKAQLCVEGARRLTAFCEARNIPYRLVGKLIIAVDEAELPALDELERRALANGVPGLRRLSSDGIRDVEPDAVGLAALHSPATGIVDFKTVAEAYAAAIRERGGVIRLGARVTSIAERPDHIDVRAGHLVLRAKTLVTCGGLESDRLAALSDTGARPQLRIVPFRGDYYFLREGRARIRGLIYPVPDPRFPFLGVHFTRRMDGGVWLGPNAVLAFAREGYRMRDVSVRDLMETVTFPGFWRMARRYWKVGAGEMWRDLSRPAFAAALRRYVPSVRDSDLVGRASGVRAQAVARDGSLVDDFVISEGARVVHVHNAPSPAATSSLAIGDLIAKRVLDRLTAS